MKEPEAKQITAALFRMYPSASATPETFTGFVEFFAGLYDPLLAIQAVNDVVLVETRLPSVAAINEAYRARVHVKRGDTPALEAAEVDDEGRLLPQTAEEWAKLGAAHRSLRAQRFSETADPATEQPLPRTRLEFNKEWGEFATLRYNGSGMVRQMPS